MFFFVYLRNLFSPTPYNLPLPPLRMRPRVVVFPFALCHTEVIACLACLSAEISASTGYPTVVHRYL